MADIGWVLKLILTAILLVVLGVGVLLLLALVSSPELALITSPELASNTSPELALITSLESYYGILELVVFSVVFMIIGIAGLYWIYSPQEAKPVDL
jgi:hypothetical protein